MARAYKISEICGDWALRIKEPGELHEFLYFKSKNNAELVKAILEWEDTHLNEAVPYKPTLTQPNNPLTIEELREMDGEPVYVVFLPDVDGEQLEMWALVRTDKWGEVYLMNNLGGSSTYEEVWTDLEAIYRRKPGGE